MTNYLKSGLAAAMIAGATMATPALAQQAEGNTVSVSVEYADLDLSTEEGQDRLEARLRRAARYACGMDIRQTGSLIPSAHARTCYANALDSFEVQIANLVAEDAERRG